MPHPLWRILALSVVTVTASAQFVEDSSDSTVVADTTSFVIYPWQHPVAPNSPGFVVTRVSDDWTRHIYSGASAFNMLRGRTPGLSISSATPGATGGVRGSGSLWVIDGLPANSGFSSFYNLNSFDYAAVTAAGAASAGVLYGAPAGEGLVTFQSRTGEGYEKSALEFNSVTTLIPGEDADFPVEDRWQFSNALAYMKDFGPVDTRISYRFLTYPYPDNDDGHSRNHNIRANTGVDITRNLSARLILDYGGYNYLQNFPGNDLFPASYSRLRSETAQGNIILQYEPFKGMKLTTQHAVTALRNKESRPTSTETDDQDRRSHNIVAAYEKRIIPNLTIGGFAGYHGEYASFERGFESESMSFGQWANYKNRAFFTGVTSRVSDFLSFELGYRTDGPSSFSADNNYRSWFANTSFVFSNAFSLTSSNLNSGRIRASYADLDFGVSYLLPFDPGNGPFMHPPLISPSKNFELGMDYQLFQNRVTFSATYFHDHDTRVITYLEAPSYLGYPYVIHVTEIKSRGWESMLSVNTISSPRTKMSTAFSWWATKSFISFLSGSTDSGDDGRDFPGGPYPTWTAGVHNTLTIDDLFFVNLLIDVNKIERFGTIMNNPPTYGMIETSLARVNDLSFGMLFDRGDFARLPFSALRVSLSARNLITLHENDVDAADVISPFVPVKSVSLAVTASF